MITRVTSLLGFLGVMGLFIVGCATEDDIQEEDSTATEDSTAADDSTATQDNVESVAQPLSVWRCEVNHSTGLYTGMCVDKGQTCGLVSDTVHCPVGTVVGDERTSSTCPGKWYDAPIACNF